MIKMARLKEWISSRIFEMGDNTYYNNDYFLIQKIVSDDYKNAFYNVRKHFV